MRRSMVPVVAVLVGGLLAACGGSGDGSRDRSGVAGPPDASADAAPTDAATPTDAGSTPDEAAPTPDEPEETDPDKAGLRPTTTPPRTVPALTCGDLANARLGSTSARYQGYADYLPLRDGRWSGEDGATLVLQEPCGIGDLDGDGAADAVGAVVLAAGGTGRFWSLVVWRNVDGVPSYLTVSDVGDRTPIESIDISDQQARVVYLTRSETASMAELNIRRTATYALSGVGFRELDSTDEPYTP